MLNYEYYNPVNIVFGKNQFKNLKNLIPANSKVMITYGGGSIKKNGIYDKVINALEIFDVIEFGGIEPNPSYQTLMGAVELGRKEKIDFILAVGGGSVIDGTKFISAAIPFTESEPWNIVDKNLGKQLTKVIPYGTVLTLPATGSEMNTGAVITNHSTNDKKAFGGPLLYAKFSLLNPEVVGSLPLRQIQNGIIDAFTHTTEQYITYPSSAKLQERFAESILKTLIEVAPKIINNPNDYESASELMYSANMALNGMLRCGVPTDWATHMIGHELTAVYNIDHARTLAIVGPNLYKVMFDDKKEKLTQYGKRVWNITEGTNEEIAGKAIDKTTSFFKSLGVDIKLSQYTNETDKIYPHIEDKFTERGWLKLGEKGHVTLDKIKEIIELSI